MPLPEWPYTPAKKEFSVSPKTTNLIKNDGLVYSVPVVKPTSLFSVTKEYLTEQTESRWIECSSPARVLSGSSNSRVNTFLVSKPNIFYRGVS